MNTTQRREFVRNSDSFQFASSPGDGATRYHFQRFVAVGLKEAQTYATYFQWGQSKVAQEDPATAAPAQLAERVTADLDHEKRHAAAQGMEHGVRYGGERAHA